MSNIQTGAERMPHDLSHLGFLAGQIGRLITISTTPVIAGDSFEMDAVGALRLSPLRRGLAIEDRKSGSAGMPRPSSYAVFCLKKKNSITKSHTISIGARSYYHTDTGWKEVGRIAIYKRPAPLTK